MYHFRQNADLRAANQFVQEHYEALQNASFLIGGATALTRCQKLFEDLRQTSVLSRRLKRELCSLHMCISLQSDFPSDCDEYDFFLEIDPSDPIVEDICLLSDALFELLEYLDCCLDGKTGMGFDVVEPEVFA